MPAPSNRFKKALAGSEVLNGLWLALVNPYSAELCAGAGFDWLLIDAEHGPNTIPTIAAQLQAISARPSHPVVRLPTGETWMIKQALDIGAQSLLIPMVESADQARQLASACRYPPAGVRGMGAGLGRAADFGRVSDYASNANDEVCLIVQIESRAGLEDLDAIATVEGVDALLIGPVDLAADMGHGGDVSVPEVADAVEEAIRRIRALGKPAGIMTTHAPLARRALEAGATFIATGSDVGLLARGAAGLLAEMRAL